MKIIPIIYKNCAKIRQNISIPKSERHLLTNNSMLQQVKQLPQKQTGLHFKVQPVNLFHQKIIPDRV